MKAIFTFLLFSLFLNTHAQDASIKGQLQDENGAAIVFANVILHSAADSTMVKVETTNDAGIFQIRNVVAGDYFIKASYVGLPDFVKNDVNLTDNQTLDLGILSFAPQSVELQQATVTAYRALVEIKPDRTVFNVQGTINSVGSNAIELLRKAPSVNVDNNDNVSVLGRSGVRIFVDGKQVPLSGDDLNAYLRNLPAEQIDRIDIITNPGARYEAEGNAGIVDIRLKKDKNLGANGSVSGTYTQGQRTRYNLSGTGNYRNKAMNIFGSLGYGDNESLNNMTFDSYQNGLLLREINNGTIDRNFYNYRLGTDFFVDENHTVGFLISGREASGEWGGFNEIKIGQQDTPNQVDSVLVAISNSDTERTQNTFNLNYRFLNKAGRTLNADLDYGRYRNDTKRFQPNKYYLDEAQEVLSSQVINSFDTPTDIDIYTFQLDFEEEIWGGKLGLGSKLSRVLTENTFLFNDVVNGEDVLNNQRSNQFDYTENVYAGYVSFSRAINEKWNFTAGLRAEQTDAEGDLTAFDPTLQEPPVKLNYLSWFPSAGLTWQIAQMHSLALNYGRRINRPDYNVLNPFRNQLSEISFELGNPELNPEIVNNLELGYTLAYRYNFKIAYSKTDNQITRLIGPDEEDPRAGFISWNNLASQTVYSFNASLPFQLAKKWNAFFNINASHLNNQADYGDGAVVDVQVFTYNFFMQHTFDLPKGFKGEVSGYFSGPGVWGGVFEYEETWSLNLGLQRKFFQDKLNVRLSANDIFFQSGWNGVSRFDGLESFGSGNWDSRNVSLSLSYNFGNQNVKSRKRKTSLESEAGRVGG